jgi:hypothetical protein
MVHWFQIIREGRFQMYDDQPTMTNTLNPTFVRVRDASPEKAPDGLANGYADNVCHHTIYVEVQDRMLYRPKSNKRRNSTSYAPVYPGQTIGHVPHRYPTEQIKYRPGSDRYLGPPIAIFYGGSDTLPDMHALLRGLNHNSEPEGKETDTGHVQYQRKPNEKNLSPLVYLKCVPEYEHLCLLWADTMDQKVIPDVLHVLKSYRRI